MEIFFPASASYPAPVCLLLDRLGLSQNKSTIFSKLGEPRFLNCPLVPLILAAWLRFLLQSVIEVGSLMAVARVKYNDEYRAFPGIYRGTGRDLGAAGEIPHSENGKLRR